MIESNKIHHITEMWVNEDKTKCKSITYKVGEEKPPVNEELTIMLYKMYFDIENKLIKEEKADD